MSLQICKITHYFHVGRKKKATYFPNRVLYDCCVKQRNIEASSARIRKGAKKVGTKNSTSGCVENKETSKLLI